LAFFGSLTSRSFYGDPQLLKLAVQAYALGIAYEFDPYFGLSISRVDPLPHQLGAVYDHLLAVCGDGLQVGAADSAGTRSAILTGSTGTRSRRLGITG
jgi:hypothetical protein